MAYRYDDKHFIVLDVDHEKASGAYAAHGFTGVSGETIYRLSRWGINR